MKNKLQEDLEREELLKDSDNIKSFNKAITKVDNERLREYFYEYSKEIDDGKAIQNVFNFIQWVIANKQNLFKC